MSPLAQPTPAGQERQRWSSPLIHETDLATRSDSSFGDYSFRGEARYYQPSHSDWTSRSRILLPDYSNEQSDQFQRNRAARGLNGEYDKRANLWDADYGCDIQRHNWRNQWQWDRERNL